MTTTEALKILRKRLKQETDPDKQRHIKYLIEQRKRDK
jgi:hypothetical protein